MVFLTLTIAWIVGFAMAYFAPWQNVGGTPASLIGEIGCIVCGIATVLLIALPAIRLIEWFVK
jgi:hypothetical protein